MKLSITKKKVQKNSKISESEFLKSEKELYAIFSAMTEIILIFDNKGNYLNIISTGTSKPDKPSQKIIGKNISEVFPAETAKLFLKKIKTVARQKENIQFEYKIELKGKEAWFNAILYPYNSNKILWVARDISRQKKIELDNSASNTKYKLLMEEANDAIIIADASTGKLLEANKKAQILLGRSLTEIKKMNQTDIHPRVDRKKAKENFQSHINKSATTIDREIVKHKNGRLIPVEITTSVIEINNKKYMQGIYRDISEEIKYKDELKQQISFFEQVYFQSSLSTQILDKDGWCLKINPKLTELFGVQPEDIEGKKYNIFKDQSLIDGRIIPLLKRVFKKGKTAEWNILFDIGKAADSQNIKVARRHKRWFHNKAYPVFDNNGKIRNVIIHHEDITDKKEIEERIKMLAFSLENITECVSITDLNDNIIYVNQAFLKIYGYSLRDIIGKNVAVLRPGKISGVPENRIYPKTIEGGWQGNLMNLKKNGSVFPIHLSTAIVKDENNKPIALIGIAIDITSRLEQEKLLKDSEEKYRLLAEASHDMIFIIGVSDEIIYVNNYGAEQFGLKPAQMIGKKRNEFFRNSTSKHQGRRLQKIFETKESLYVEDKIELSGKILHLGTWLVPIKDSSGEVISVMRVSRDITKRVLQDKELLKLSSAVEQSPVSVLITNTSGYIEYVNPTFTKVTGYCLDEVKGKNPKILSSGESPKSVYKKLWETITSGKTWQGEFHNKRKSGELFWEYASISPIIDKQGEITSFIAIKEDITQKKLAQLELVAAKEKAEEMSELKTKFLANMSHELRTPLIGVLGYAEILLNDLNEDDQKEMVSTIFNSGKRLLNTLNLLLDLSRIESNKEELNFSKKNIGEITTNAVKLFSMNAESKNLVLETKIINNIEAEIDERIFVQIINNLVNNAIKFTDEGNITVEIDSEITDFIVRIKDTGIGIPKDKQEIIFDEFRQVSEGLSRRHQGTGLGLTITKKYIEMLNGTISVESIESIGSVFTVKIPINKTLINKELKNA